MLCSLSFAKYVALIILSLPTYTILAKEEGGNLADSKGGGFSEKQATLNVVKSFAFTKNGESRNYILIQPPPISRIGHSEESIVEEPPSWFFKTIQGGGTKDLRYLILTVDVYDKEFSKITWEEDGSQFTAYCRMDFNKLKHLSFVEIDSTIYSLSCWVSNWSSEALAATKQMVQEQGLDIPFEEVPPAFEKWEEDQDAYLYAGDQEHSIPGNLEALDVLHRIYADLPESPTVEKDPASETASPQTTANSPDRSQTIIFWPKKNSRYANP